MSHGNSSRGGRCIAVLVLSLLCALQSLVLADSTTLTDKSTGEVVLLKPGKMHSSVASSSSLVGLWPHGDGRGDDAAFFKAQDDAYEKWMAKKTQELLEQKQRRGKKNGEDSDEDDKNGKRKNSKKTQKAKLESFSAEAVRARRNARRKRIKDLKNSSSFEVEWNEIRVDADRVKQLLYDTSSYTLYGTPGGTAEEQYVHLLKTVFSHTMRNMTEKRGTSWIDRWQYALPYPVVLDGRYIVHVEREVRDIKEHMKMVEKAKRTANFTDDFKDINETKKEIRQRLIDSADMLLASREAHKMVIELVLPLTSDFSQSVGTQLREINAKIIGNDESTALLRQQLKEWTRRKSILKAYNEKLVRVEFELRRAVYSKTLLPEEAFISSLALIAKLRLGQNTGIEVVDMAAGLGTCVALTAAQESELKESLFYPSGVSLLVVAILSWVLLGTRNWFLKGIRQTVFQAQRTSKLSGHSRGKFSFRRLCFRVNLLVEALVPFVVPTLVLYVSLVYKKEDVSLYSILLFSLPVQRLAFFVGLVLFYALNYIVFFLMSVLYEWSSRSFPQRKVKKS